MKNVIYIDNRSGEVVNEGTSNSTAYFSEELVLKTFYRVLMPDTVRDIIAYMKRLKGGEK